MQEASEIQRKYFARVCEIIDREFCDILPNMFAEFEFCMNGYSPQENISPKHWKNWIEHFGTFLTGLSIGSNGYFGSNKNITLPQLKQILKQECMVPDEGIYVFDFKDAGPLSLQPHKIIKESVFCKDCYTCKCGICHSCTCHLERITYFRIEGKKMRAPAND